MKVFTYLFVSCLLIFSFSTPSIAKTYLPWVKSDYAVYQNDRFDTLKRATVDKKFFDWRHFTEFSGFGTLWEIEQNGKLFLFDLNTLSYFMLVDFNAAPGDTRQINIPPCNIGTATLASKEEQIMLPAGTFDHVVRLDFETNCADGGVTNTWFAAGVGPIQWRESSIAGPVTYAMTEAMIAGKSYPQPQGIFIQGEFPTSVTQKNVANPGAAPPSINLYMTINNYTNTMLHYAFNSSQRFDIRLKNSNQKIVSQWSWGKLFATVLGTVSIAAGDNYRVGGELVLSDRDGNKLPADNYTLEITLSSRPDDATNHPLGSSAPTVRAPFTIIP